MRRGTTPTLVFTTDTDLTDYNRVILTLECGGESFDFEGDRLGVTTDSLSVTLTQAETLALGGIVEAQVRAVSTEGVAIASDICSLDVKRILKEGVINA